MIRLWQKRHIGLLAWVSVLLVSSGALAQSVPDERGRGGDREGRRQRRGDGDWRGGRGWFGGGFNEENQAEMYDRIADRHLQRFSRRYDLDETQRQQVKSHLEQLKKQQRAYAAPLRDEMRDLIEEARDLRRARRAGEEVDNERSREIWQRFSEIRQGSPLMDFRSITSQVESMLPPEQVQKARERDDRPGFQGAGQQDGWRRYLDRFNTRYKLDESQRATAESIYRNLNEQRERYRQAHKADFTAAEQIANRDQRITRQRELNDPIQNLFTEFRSKLDQIPTASQKAAAPPEPERRRGRAQTRPAVTGQTG